MFSEVTVDSRRPSGRPRNRDRSYKSKQRRVQGACDVCKKRKIRCDSAEMPHNRCTHCTNLGLDCTHADIMKTLSSENGYVSALENRVEKMENLLSKLLPGIDFSKQLENETDVEPLSIHNVETLPRNDADELTVLLNKLKINPEENRFFGKSSGVQLVQTALDFQTRFAGLSQVPRPILPNKRKEYWEPPQWLLPVNEEGPQYTFPDPDLIPVLVDLYFTEVNCFRPVLHRPTFDRKVADGLHFVDHRFAATLLIVCSLGARHSEDSRVVFEGQTTRHSAGWKWYEQVRVIPKDLVYKPDLYELQTIALSVIYLMALSPTAVGWHQIGIGLRRAQDVGAHRRKIQLTPTAENEQWKRVFWVLLTLEWMYGTHSGRPLVMHDQDYDQELPIECDDDYWDLPEPHNFKQPKGKPSSIAYFNCHVKLLEIQAAITTTLYSPRKPTNLSCRPSPLTDSQAIVSFDSALNSWFSQIPDHLRWDSERKNQQHFNQSALLYTTYYNVLILLHRPFIPEPLSTSTPAAQPSLVICTNAARSSARIFDAQHKRGTFLNVNQLAATFTAGIVLLLNIWTGRRSSVNCDPPKELDLVYKCVQAMGDIETSFYAAGRYHDVLNRLIHAGGSVDIMFQDFNSTKCRPPVAQHGAGSAASPLTQDPQSAAQWSYTFTRHHIEDLEHALHAILRSQIRVPDSRYSEGFPNGSGHLPHAVYDFEQSHEHTDMDSSIFSANMPVVDSDLMSMWSNAPVGFHVDDWSYIMPEDIGAAPQFDELAPSPERENASSSKIKNLQNNFFTCMF